MVFISEGCYWDIFLNCFQECYLIVDFLEHGESVSAAFLTGSSEHENQVSWWFALFHFNVNIKYSVLDRKNEWLWEEVNESLS